MYDRKSQKLLLVKKDDHKKRKKELERSGGRGGRGKEVVQGDGYSETGTMNKATEIESYKMRRKLSSKKPLPN